MNTISIYNYLTVYYEELKDFNDFSKDYKYNFDGHKDFLILLNNKELLSAHNKIIKERKSIERMCISSLMKGRQYEEFYSKFIKTKYYRNLLK